MRFSEFPGLPWVRSALQAVPRQGIAGDALYGRIGGADSTTPVARHGVSTDGVPLAKVLDDAISGIASDGVPRHGAVVRAAPQQNAQAVLRHPVVGDLHPGAIGDLDAGARRGAEGVGPVTRAGVPIHHDAGDPGPARVGMRYADLEAESGVVQELATRDEDVVHRIARIGLDVQAILRKP